MLLALYPQPHQFSSPEAPVLGPQEMHLPTLRATMSFHHAHRQAYNQSEGWQFLLQEN